MGIYARRDSKYWWMLLETSGQKLSTKVLVAAPDAYTRKHQRQQAEAIYRARMTDLARTRAGLPAIGVSALAFDAFADWYDTHVIAKHRGKEREREILPLLRAHCGGMPISAITPGTATEYETARLEAGVRPRTVNREIALLKSMLTVAVAEGHLEASPLKGRPLLRAVKRKKRIIQSPKEEALLLAQLAPDDQALYIVAVDTLIRLSNVLHLRRDEDKGDRLELTDSKTGPYAVPLSARARQALDALPDRGPYYFAHRRTAKSERTQRAIIRRMLERACKRAKIPYGWTNGGITFHTATRATGATRMLRKGFDLRTVQGAGNWKDIRAVQEYLHTDDAEVRRAVRQSAPPIDLNATRKAAAEAGKARRIAQARKAGQARHAKRPKRRKA